MRHRRAVWTPVFGVVVIALALAALATVPLSAGAVPDANCAGGGGGAIFVADSGFTVEYNDSQPMPDNGPFRGEETLRFRNVTLTSSGDASVRLESGTGPETCLAAVDASPAPVVINSDGEQAVVIDGTVDALSLGDADYGAGAVDFAYEASGPWRLTIPSTGLGGGTDIVAVDGSGTEIATGTVDGSGALTLALPDGSRAVDLQQPTAEISVVAASAGPSEALVNETVDVTAEIRNDGDASGEYMVTLTANGQVVAEEMVTVPANTNETVTLRTQFDQPGTYALALDGQDISDITVSESQPSDDQTDDSAQDSRADDGDQADSGGGGPPWLLILVIVALIAGLGGYVLARRSGDDSAQTAQAGGQHADEPAAGVGDDRTQAEATPQADDATDSGSEAPESGADETDSRE